MYALLRIVYIAMLTRYDMNMRVRYGLSRRLSVIQANRKRIRPDAFKKKSPYL